MDRTPLDVPSIVASIKDGKAPTALRPRPAVQRGRIERKPFPVADPAAQAAYQESLILRRAAKAIRALPLAPSTTITLADPLLIWQTMPALEPVFIGAEYTPGDAGLLIRVEDVGPAHNYYRFVFYYIWENLSEYYAVVNVSTSLVLTGTAAASTNAGILTSDFAVAELSCYLDLIRNGGWGIDPITNTPADGTEYPAFQQTMSSFMASLNAQFAITSVQEDFSVQPFDLSFVDMVVPGGASVLFGVTLSVSDSISAPESNMAEFDFATGGNRIACPGIDLEILTPVGDGVTGLTPTGQLVTQPLAQ
jgi:hypothetical protein